MPRVLDGESSDHCVQAGLGGCVVLAPRRSEDRGGTASRDQGAALTALDHVPDRLLERLEHALHVDLEDAAPLFHRHVDEGRTAAADAGVGEARVDLAQEVHGALE